jgi:hypothetical protein
MHSLLSNIEVPFDLASLVSAIQSRAAVVYVGAGASVPVGLPTWSAFLSECLHRARQADSRPDRWQNTQRLLEAGDYLTAAEILQREIGQSLEHYVWDIFGRAYEPSNIHRAIARIPFSLAITTNYDRLLESAYLCSPNVWTWRDPAAIFGAIKNDRFAVVKVHGEVGNGPSLVLTKTQYRDLLHLNKEFNDCLTTLLSLKTFLFVGSSLRDHNLLGMMDDARLTYGADFGPHYAIMFNDQLDDAFVRLLHDSYNIHVVRCSEPQGDNRDWRTRAVCSFLKVLSGLVAQRSPDAFSALSLDSPIFNLRSVSKLILNQAISRTGSHRGRIAFVNDINIHRLYTVTEQHARQKNQRPDDEIADSDELTRWDTKELLVEPTSALGTLFLQGASETPFFYYDDTVSGNCEANFPHTPLPPYEPTHSDVRSALACQIHADGQRVGVFLLESFNHDAYTQDHLNAILDAAVSAGAAYTEYRHRSAAAGGIRPFIDNMAGFHSLMDMSRSLRELSLSYLLYEIDYASGVVVAHYDSSKVTVSGPSRQGGYRFDESSLVTTVLGGRTAAEVPDCKDKMLSQKGVQFFGINSPVFATP